MAVEPMKDYEAAFESYNQKVSQNAKTFSRILTNTLDQISQTCQHEKGLNNKIKGEITDLQKKIEITRDDIESVRTNKDRAGREKQKLQYECDQMNMVVDEKIRERDELREMLGQREQRLKEKEEQVASDERRHQEKMNNVEKGMLLYQSHLGLKIQRTRHNTLVFVFTQVNRSDPNKEYMLELTLEEDSYRLISSDPPIANLKELEERLNVSNDFSGCIVHIRNLFLNMDG